MVINHNNKKERCISEIINIIKKNNITIIDIINTYISNFNITFTNEEKYKQRLNYLDFLNLNDLLNQKNITNDYIFI